MALLDQRIHPTLTHLMLEQILDIFTSAKCQLDIIHELKSDPYVVDRIMELWIDGQDFWRSDDELNQIYIIYGSLRFDRLWNVYQAIFNLCSPQDLIVDVRSIRPTTKFKYDVPDDSAIEKIVLNTRYTGVLNLRDPIAKAVCLHFLTLTEQQQCDIVSRILYSECPSPRIMYGYQYVEPVDIVDRIMTRAETQSPDIFIAVIRKLPECYECRDYDNVRFLEYLINKVKSCKYDETSISIPYKLMKWNNYICMCFILRGLIVSRLSRERLLMFLSHNSLSVANIAS